MEGWRVSGRSGTLIPPACHSGGEKRRTLNGALGRSFGYRARGAHDTIAPGNSHHPRCPCPTELRQAVPPLVPASVPQSVITDWCPTRHRRPPRRAAVPTRARSVVRHPPPSLHLPRTRRTQHASDPLRAPPSDRLQPARAGAAVSRRIIQRVRGGAGQHADSEICCKARASKIGSSSRARSRVGSGGSTVIRSGASRSPRRHHHSPTHVTACVLLGLRTCI
ncbi:hypothetical protein FB451DRAFT_463816 [Mycena latifolia]|nr:hypothetical protein FB451DRAFT_463816 [Mycena latifolia]